jgi:hypothetical protein
MRLNSFRSVMLLVRAALLSVVFATLVAMPAVAKEKPEWRSWPLGDRFTASVGLYRPKLDTKAAIGDAEGNLGALIGFEETLGLSDTKNTPIINFRWRVSKRNVLSMNYFELDRSSTQNSTFKLFVEDPPVERDVTLPLSAVFNIESIDITYDYSIIFTKKHNLGIGLGLALQKLEFGFKPTADCDGSDFPDCDVVEPHEAKATAPLPTFNIMYQYAINDKWIIDTSFGYLSLELELDNNEDLGGEIWNINAGIVWKAWEHAGFNLGYKLFDVNVDYQKREVVAAADYDYRGVFAGVSAFF